jgi:ATP-dependent DNA helicase RecG
MRITAAQIDFWRSAPTETEVLEFKEAKAQFNIDSLYRYCVAIGNEGGGHLLLGIKDKPPRQIVGSRAIDNPIGMQEKIFDKLNFRVDIEAVDHPDGRVVVVSIPSCPTGSPYHLEGSYLMRVGQALMPMSPERLRELFSAPEVEWIEMPTKTGIDAAAVVQLLDIEVFTSRFKLPGPVDAETAMKFLVKEMLIDEEGQGLFTIRRIGALLLARDLKEFPDLTRKAPRVVSYKGETKLTDPSDYAVGSMGYAVGFSKLLNFVTTRIAHKEVIRDGIRREVSTIPEIVARELLANALVHQDLSVTGTSVVVELFENRMEISNPGRPVVPVDRLIHEARSRNERLADLMRRMGICEERGSGIDKVVHAAESLHLPAPEFRATGDRMHCVVHGPRSFDKMDRADRIRACYQHCALKWEFAQRMTNQSLRERFNLPNSKIHLVSQVIQNAIEDTLIKPDEKAGPSKKFACYVPAWA